MSDTVHRDEGTNDEVKQRQRYESPKLVVHGTIQELTATLPGASPTDGDPEAAGSNVP